MRRAWRNARSIPACRARSMRSRPPPTPMAMSRARCARSGSRATMIGGSAATMATAWTSSPSRILQGRRHRALPGAHAVPRGDRAGHGRARGRAVQLRDHAVGQGSGRRSEMPGSLCARRVRLGDGGARAVGGWSSGSRIARRGLPFFSREEAPSRPRWSISPSQLPHRHRQGEGRLGGASAQGRGQGRRARNMRARHRAGRGPGARPRRQAGAARPSRLSPRSTRRCSSSAPNRAGTC
jgi:hypothetical protein